MAYFTMAMALFADEDYEEVAARLGRLGGVLGPDADVQRGHAGPAAAQRRVDGEAVLAGSGAGRGPTKSGQRSLIRSSA
jgi:hypothetical protein